ncbi:hypothetical protein LCGC14_0336380 [marine sediment metagenome]|uniref:Uncharacterized protein n=1 Tax=marine sediment metagenome TaxID=412755 RepID=A0A0F9WMG9_9ZZZZ
MSSLNTAPERPVYAEGEENLESVSFDGVLDSGELLASVTSVTELTSTDLTISNEAVSTAALIINNVTVITGRAIQFKVVGQLVATGSYTLKLIVVTDSSPAQKKVKFVEFVTKGS